MDLTIYLIVRTDLKMQRGKIAAQCGHAVENLVHRCPHTIYQKYSDNAHPKVVLAVASLKEFEELRSDCYKAHIAWHVVTDAGKTQVKPGTQTVLGVGPVSKKNVPASISNLKLL